MAELYYPFESVNTGTASEPVYDRAITAEDERTFNKLRYTNGVFSSVGSGLAVSANNNMTVTVGTGGAHIEGALYYNSAPINLAVEAANASLNRIDRVVLQFNTSVSVRSVRVLIRTGTAATNPVAPELRQESNLFEIALADIYVKKGATGISQSAITDQRLNSALCGFVAAAIPASVDTTGLFDQYQTALNEWLDTVAAALDGTLAGNLQNQITALGTRLTAEEDKVQPVDKGGTGATTAAEARENLGVKACGTYDTLPVAKGGTGKTTAAEALKALGGISWTKVWENAAASSAFRDQTITVESGDAYIVVCRTHTNDSNNTVSCIAFENARTIIAGRGFSNAPLGIVARALECSSGNLSFSKGYSQNTYESDTENNSVMIPIKIYSVKGVI